jgi:hypothetical protein
MLELMVFRQLYQGLIHHMEQSLPLAEVVVAEQIQVNLRVTVALAAEVDTHILAVLAQRQVMEILRLLHHRRIAMPNKEEMAEQVIAMQPRIQAAVVAVLMPLPEWERLLVAQVVVMAVMALKAHLLHLRLVVQAQEGLLLQVILVVAVAVVH